MANFLYFNNGFFYVTAVKYYLITARQLPRFLQTRLPERLKHKGYMSRLPFLLLFLCIITYFIGYFVPPLGKYKKECLIAAFILIMFILIKLFDYIMILRVKGKYNIAIKIFHLLKYLLPPYQFWMIYVEMLLESEKYSEARTEIEKIKNKKNMPKWLTCYSFAKKENNFSGAEILIKEALSYPLSKDLSVAFMGDLGLLLIENFPRRAHEAKKLFQDAINIKTSKSLKLIFQGLTGCADVVAGSFQEGIIILENTTKLLYMITHINPLIKIYIAIMYKYLGIAYANLNSKQKANEYFHKGLNLTGIKEIKNKINFELMKYSLPQ